MAFDVQRFVGLRERAAFNMEAYKGTWQDQSKGQRVLTPSGSPTWSQINGLPATRKNIAGDGAVSAVTPAIVDVTTNFSLEWLMCPDTDGSYSLLAQTGSGVGGGGLVSEWRTIGGDTNMIVIYLYDAAMAARMLYTSNNFHIKGRTAHVAFSSYNGGATGKFWLNTIPATANLFGAVAPTNIVVNRTVSFMVSGGSMGRVLFVRAYPFALDNADVAALYGAAKSLVGEI